MCRGLLQLVDLLLDIVLEFDISGVLRFLDDSISVCQKLIGGEANFKVTDNMEIELDADHVLKPIFQKVAPLLKVTRDAVHALHIAMQTLKSYILFPMARSTTIVAADFYNTLDRECAQQVDEDLEVSIPS